MGKLLPSVIVDRGQEIIPVFSGCCEGKLGDHRLKVHNGEPSVSEPHTPLLCVLLNNKDGIPFSRILDFAFPM